MKRFLFFLFLPIACFVAICPALAQTEPYAYVSLDTVHIDHESPEDWSLVFYKPHFCKVNLTFERPDSLNDKTALSVACIFTAGNFKDVVGDYVLNGQYKHNRRDRETGLCYMDKDTIIVDTLTLEKSLYYRDMAVRNNASYFQQMLLLKGGDTLECTIFRRQKPTFRRCLALYRGRGVVVESVNRLSFEDFANALKQAGIKEAIYLDMGTWSDGFVRLEDKTIYSIGHLKYNTKHQTNWLQYTFYKPPRSKHGSKVIRSSNKHKPGRKRT